MNYIPKFEFHRRDRWPLLILSISIGLLTFAAFVLTEEALVRDISLGSIFAFTIFMVFAVIWPKRKFDVVGPADLNEPGRLFFHVGYGKMTFVRTDEVDGVIRYLFETGSNPSAVPFTKKELGTLSYYDRYFRIE